MGMSSGAYELNHECTGGKITTIFYCINKTPFVSIFVYKETITGPFQNRYYYTIWVILSLADFHIPNLNI